MNNNMLDIDSRNDELKISLKKNEVFDLFYIFMLIMLGFMHIILIFFVFNSIINDGIMAIKVVFVIIGVLMFWNVNKQFRMILLFVKGKEEVRINKDSIYYKSEFGMIKKQTHFRIDKIKKFELVKLGNDMVSQYSKIFSKIKYGMIEISVSKKNKIVIGQYLEQEDLELLHRQLENRIQLIHNNN